MNVTSAYKRAAILTALANGASVRATSRMTGASKGTVLRLLVEAGEFCQVYHDKMARNLPTARLECDEVWSFFSKKQRKVQVPGQGGDLWTHVALDAERKFIVSWLVGDRSKENTYALVQDTADRIPGRVQISTDAWPAYENAIRSAFGWPVGTRAGGVGRADYGKIVKEYKSPGDQKGPRRYSPPVCTKVRKVRVIGTPDMDTVSTSYVENLNLSIRQHCRRFTRLTSGHSKKAENHAYAVALNFFAHNFVRVHGTLTKKAGRKTTPAMAMGLTDRPLTVEDLNNWLNPKNVTIK